MSAAVTKATVKMMEYVMSCPKGGYNDISHFQRVLSFAKTIGEGEGLDRDAQELLEIAAVVHDIGCPFCRQKYGSSEAKLQEAEGAVISAEFLKDIDIPQAAKERINYIVGHHHTLDMIDGIDYQIIIEADYLVNAHDGQKSKENVQNMMEKVFKTKTGIHLLKTLYEL